MKSILLDEKLLGLVEMTSGLVNASFSLPEWQAVKMIFFAPWWSYKQSSPVKSGKMNKNQKQIRPERLMGQRGNLRPLDGISEFH